MEVVNNDPARRITGSFLLVVVVAFLVTTVLAYDIHQNRIAIHRIKQVQAAQREFRIQRAARTGATDYLICKAENSTREVERRRINRDFANLDRNLRLLHIRKTPELLRIARADRNRNLADLKPLPCGQLPSTGGAFPKPRKKGKR